MNEKKRDFCIGAKSDPEAIRKLTPEQGAVIQANTNKLIEINQAVAKGRRRDGDG